jgi:hypothetical protein
MNVFSAEHVRGILKQFLDRTRALVDTECLSPSRLPGWLRGARVRAGWVHRTLVAVIDDGPSGDEYEFLGRVRADTVILWHCEDFEPEGSVFALPRGPTLFTTIGQLKTGSEGSTMALVANKPMFLDTDPLDYGDYHSPNALCNLFIQHRPKAAEMLPRATAFIPFALYVHQSDLESEDVLWERCAAKLSGLFRWLDANVGDFYAARDARLEAVSITKERFILVLGRDSDPESLREMRAVRDYLRGRGYESELLKDLPEIAVMSNTDKLRLWAMAARFCVMVDRLPSGHLTEYEILRAQRSILALMRETGRGSSYMIGDDHLVDVNHIQVFEFHESPLTELDNVVGWAEGVADRRAKAFGEAYPWRSRTA